MPRALVLEQKGELALRDIDLPSILGPDDVKIRIDTVGICGSDVHYYTHGKIGPFIVDAPMVLGHEAAGTIVDIGTNVNGLKIGDRVCMEPGVPDPNSKASKLGIYNVDPAVRFWATPPIHGCLTEHVVHPARFTYRLPDNVSFAQGAMVEPFAIGMQAAFRAGIKPGDVALVQGAGPIGMMVALAALAGGCAEVVVTDFAQPKLDLIGRYEGIKTLNLSTPEADAKISAYTRGWGYDKVFECSGAAPAILQAPEYVCPGGTLVLVGMPVDPAPIDIVALQAKEVRIETIFRYANMYERAINLIESGKVDLNPLISHTFDFEQSIDAFDRAVEQRPDDVKLQIKMV